MYLYQTPLKELTLIVTLLFSLPASLFAEENNMPNDTVLWGLSGNGSGDVADSNTALSIAEGVLTL